MLIAIFALPAQTLPTATAAQRAAAQCVILLHGLARTSASMNPLAEALTEAGYRVVNDDYPSRTATIESLAEIAIPTALERCGEAATVHFITHSLGGILVRYYLGERDVAGLGRVVMLSPPNKGSEVVDKLGEAPGFDLLNGPAGQQLGTDAQSLPRRLGPADFEVGIITGDSTFNPILSMLIPGTDDGKVSIESAKLEGMTDFLVVPHSHPFIMSADDVICQALEFLETGRFDHGGSICK